MVDSRICSVDQLGLFWSGYGCPDGDGEVEEMVWREIGGMWSQ